MAFQVATVSASVPLITSHVPVPSYFGALAEAPEASRVLSKLSTPEPHSTLYGTDQTSPAEDQEASCPTNRQAARGPLGRPGDAPWQSS